MARALKVFRMPIGFHDAYVAASSRKAALAAWGADRDLFARGIAEEVTDPALMTDALAAPGTVIRRSRGSAAEQMAALPADEQPKVRTKAKAKIETPKPDRTALDAAEQAIEDAAADARKTAQSFDRRAAALARERRDAERRQADEVARLEEKRDEAAAAYKRAKAIWRE